MSVTYDPVDENEEAPEGEIEAEALAEDPEFYGTEDEARARGWRPLAEFRGDPRFWKDWPEWLKKGDEDATILREENRRLSKTVGRLKTQIDTMSAQQTETNAMLQRMETSLQRADRAGYERAKAELGQAKRAAVQNGDMSEYDRIEAEMAALDAAAPPTPRAAPPPPAAPASVAGVPAAQRNPDIEEFIAANPWWSNDLALQKAMVQHFGIVQELEPDLDMPEQLAMAKDRLMADFPAKFQGQQMATPPRPAAARPRPGASAVARPTGGAIARPRQATSGFATIADPKEREEAIASFAATKRSDPGMTEGEFLTIYNDPSADVLELRRQRPRA